MHGVASTSEFRSSPKLALSVLCCIDNLRKKRSVLGKRLSCARICLACCCERALGTSHNNILTLLGLKVVVYKFRETHDYF
jgi:hypothetical protein